MRYQTFTCDVCGNSVCGNSEKAVPDYPTVEFDLVIDGKSVERVETCLECAEKLRERFLNLRTATKESRAGKKRS